MRYSRINKLTAALVSALVSTQAMAGMDTIVQFANLSPYSATIEFPKGDGSCWYDDKPSDARVWEYFDYFRRDAVSDSDYRGFLEAYKNAYGLTDFAQVPQLSMAGTSASLEPAVSGGRVQQAMFIGETDAHIELNPFGDSSCKDRESNRAFNVILHDVDGNPFIKHRYLLQDPPDGEWKLSRMDPTQPDIKAQTLTLGSGGHGDPLEITLTAVTVVATVATLGYAGWQLYAARAIAFEAMSTDAVVTAFIRGGSQNVATSFWRPYFRYLFTRGLSFAGRLSTGDYIATYASSPLAISLYDSLADGAVVFAQANTSGGGKPILLDDGTDSGFVEVPPGTKIDTTSLGLDFSNPMVIPNSGLPDQRSICVYQTGTLCITECRLVGIQLTILPNGSLAFMPLPSVGGGD